MKEVKIKYTRTQKGINKKNESILNNLNNLLNKDISFSKKKIKNKTKVIIYEDLYMMLESGLDLKTSLNIIANNFKKNDKLILEQIKSNIEKGSSLSESFKSTGMFSNYEIISIQIGESTGKLASVFSNLAEYYKSYIDQTRKLIAAFSYPLIVLSTSILTIIFMMNFIVPMFEDIFKKYNSELPKLTKIVIAVSHKISDNMGFIAFIIVLFTVIIIKSRNTKWFKKNFSIIILKIPYIGDIVKKVYLHRLCMSMELLLSAKVPLIKSLEIAKEMVEFYPYNITFDGIKKSIVEGISLSSSLKHYSVYDLRIISLIMVAEETNQLDIAFGRMKIQLAKEIDHKKSLFGNVLEPLIIIFVGVFVAIILIAMYLPMFQMSTSIKY